MKKLLEKITIALNEKYKGLNPTIEIFGDGSWLIEVDNTRGPGRIGGMESGQSIEDLEALLGIELNL